MKHCFYKHFIKINGVIKRSHNMPVYGFYAGPSCPFHPSDKRPGNALIPLIIQQSLPPAAERPAGAGFWPLPALPSALIKSIGYIFFSELNMKC